MRRLVLASQSPRRGEILERAGLPFEIAVSAVAEVRAAGEDPEHYVRRLAREKAESVPLGPGKIVLAADTTVVVGEEVLEKPFDATDARRMLRLLSGREHQVLTGICLRDERRLLVDCSRTTVRFTALSAGEIEAYVASGEPMDKAGAYAIQGRASKFVHSIDGCYWNVVGLPIGLVYGHLKRDFGFAQIEAPG